MPNPRSRALWIAAAAMAITLLLCWAGYSLARKSMQTAAKVQRYAQSIDLSKLSPEERAKALRTLVDKLNALPLEERRRWRFGKDWLSQLTEEEKGFIIGAAMPAELKQELAAFERLPKEQRQKLLDEAMRHLREDDAPTGNTTPLLSNELESKVRTTGLKVLYSESSAQTKAELAPLLNELQRQMESGQFGHVNQF